MARISLLAVCLLGLLSVAVATTYFKETFPADWESRWVHSDWKKADGTAGLFKWSAGDVYGDAEEDKGIMTSQDARFYDISAKYPKFSNEGKDLVIQFQIRHPQKIDCGGGYLKILSSNFEQKDFKGDTDYNIMFGPDICGTSTKKVHVIFNFGGKNLLIKKEIRAETDQLSHVYTLIVRPDDTYEVRVDGEKRESGSLLEDWDYLLPKTIKDPSDKKPSDWVDSPKMDDPSDVKPADWDSTPKEIADPNAEKPADWDDEADGTWEAPMVPNPEFKGDWKPRQIDNPNYKGPWKQKEIPNPDYVEHKEVYKYNDFGGVGIDVWQVKAGSVFDNIIITDSVSEAEEFMNDTYNKNKAKEKANLDAAEAKKKESEDAERKRVEEEKKRQDSENDDDDDDEDDDDKKGKEHEEL